MNEPGQPLFDTHAHIISDDQSAYPPAEAERDTVVTPFTVEQLLAGMDENGATKACVVQRYFYYRTDNSYALDACRLHPDNLIPVIMLDGHEPETPTALRRLAQQQPIGGIRFARPALDVDDTAWLNSRAVMRIWEQAAELELPVAVIMFEPHQCYNLPALKLIAERFPETQIIIDHLGIEQGATATVRKMRLKPDYTPYIRAPDFGVTPTLREMLSCPNVNYKFTGINLGCLTADSIDPAVFLRFFIDEFGVDRVVCGSDIGQTEGPYSRIVSGLRDATRLLTEAERQQVLFGNADRIYTNLPG